MENAEKAGYKVESHDIDSSQNSRVTLNQNAKEALDKAKKKQCLKGFGFVGHGNSVNGVLDGSIDIGFDSGFKASELGDGLDHDLEFILLIACGGLNGDWKSLVSPSGKVYGSKNTLAIGSMIPWLPSERLVNRFFVVSRLGSSPESQSPPNGGIPNAPSSVWVVLEGPGRFEVDNRPSVSPGGEVLGEWVKFASDSSPKTKFILFLVKGPNHRLLDGSQTGYERTATSQVVSGRTWVRFDKVPYAEAVKRMYAWGRE